MRSWLGKNKYLILWVPVILGLPFLIDWLRESSWWEEVEWSIGLTSNEVVVGIPLAAVTTVGVVGLIELRRRRWLRYCRSGDVSHLGLTAPAEIQRMLDRLNAMGFKRLGEDRTDQPAFGQPTTSWDLVDRAGTTMAQTVTVPLLGTVPQLGTLPPLAARFLGAEPGKVICVFSTLFSDGAVLVTGYPLGDQQRTNRLLMQRVDTSPEDAWQQHQQSLGHLVDRHGTGQQVRRMADAIGHLATVRVRLSDHFHQSDLGIMAGWIVAAAIAWCGMVITGVAQLSSGVTAAAIDAWLIEARQPVLIGMLVAGLPTLWFIHLLIHRLGNAGGKAGTFSSISYLKKIGISHRRSAVEEPAEQGAKMRKTGWMVALFIAVGIGLSQVVDFRSTSIREYGNWSVFRINDDEHLGCYYTASRPKKQEGTYSQQRAPAVFVTRRLEPGPVDYFSVQPGYVFLNGSEVEVQIDSDDKLMLLTKGEHAWAKTEEDNRALINSMKHGVTMTVRGSASKTKYSLDTYSLDGFSAAYDAIVQACDPSK